LMSVSYGGGSSAFARFFWKLIPITNSKSE
jgi:hypothetical protein